VRRWRWRRRMAAGAAGQPPVADWPVHRATSTPTPICHRRGLLIAAAALSGIIIPWELGFGDLAELYDPSVYTPLSVLDGLLVMLFCADIGGSCCG
jgi:hypothetical protein